MLTKTKVQYLLREVGYSDKNIFIYATSFVYLSVLLFTIYEFYKYIPFWVLCVHSIAVIAILLNFVFIRRSNNPERGANILIFIIFIVHMINAQFAGGITTLHYSWILLIPILAGATLSGKGQLFFLFLTCTGTILYAVFPENIQTLPYEGDTGYALLTRLLSITVACLIMLSYHYNLKHKVEALQMAKNEAQEISNLKSQFLANMSHELRTPLNSVIGFSETIKTLEYSEKNMAKIEEYVEYINSSGNHLLGLVNDILDMAKIESGKMELKESDFWVDELISSTINLLEPQITKKSHKVIEQSQNTPYLLYADARLAKQMVLNLLSNAIKFTEKNGTIHIGYEILSNGNLHLYVRDNGRGMNEKALMKITDPFYQIDNAYARSEGGTGLGLSLVNAMIKLHSGQLSVTSTVDVGTTATLVFPKERVISE
jgi:signal transduction histidine kinase